MQTVPGESLHEMTVKPYFLGMIFTELPPLKVHPLPITFCMLGKYVSRRNIFSYFSSRKLDMTLHTNCLLRDNLYEM